MLEMGPETTINGDDTLISTLDPIAQTGPERFEGGLKAYVRRLCLSRPLWIEAHSLKCSYECPRQCPSTSRAGSAGSSIPLSNTSV